VNAKPSQTDPTLAQVEVARDPELMREIFQRHLRPLGDEAYQVRECQISRAHYLRATRRRLRYTLRLEESETGRERIELLTGVMYAEGGRARREWQELQRPQPGRAIPYALLTFEPFFFIPELEMLVQVFPYDHQLPGLPNLMAGPPPMLEPLVLARFGEGDWRTEAWDVEPVRYRTGERMTLRLRVRVRNRTTDQLEERCFYAKVYREEEDGERTYEVARKLWEKAEAGGEGFSVGRPVAYLSDLRTLIQEEVPGSSLYDVILREKEATPFARKAARALAALHLDEDVPRPRRPHPSKEDFDRRLKRIGATLLRACPHLEPEVQEIVGAVVARSEAEAPTAPTHGDLHLRHIMLHGGRPALIDLDAFAEADPLLDIALILSDLAAMPLDSPLSRARAQEASQAFVEEYFAHVPESWRDGFPTRYARAVLKRAANICRRQGKMPGWPDKVDALIKEAKSSLAGQDPR
jgi:Phosphotransferase enzyme family